MPYFLCQLRGPRPSFPHDATPDEARLMGEHGAYWSSLAEAGVAIAFGPVFDPKGPWGLALIEVKDEANARAVTEGDPVIEAGRGFRFDLHAMPHLLLRPAQASALQTS